MNKSESSLNLFFLCITIPLFSMEPSSQSYNFQSYSLPDLHQFARTHSVLQLTLRSRKSFFARMQELGIFFNPEESQANIEELSDISQKKHTCCIII